MKLFNSVMFLLVSLTNCLANDTLDADRCIVFASNQNELAISDSICSALNGQSDVKKMQIEPIVVVNGKITDAVDRFTALLDSAKYTDYDIIGIGATGSAAATISASKNLPEKLILISAPGINGKEICRRLLCSGTYIHNIPEIRAAIDSQLLGNNEADYIPEEFRELIKYSPAAYLGKITCPVYAIYGTGDKIVEWYSNCSGLESALPGNNNTIKAYLDMGYCMKNNPYDTSNIPMIGDRNPKSRDYISKEAMADLIDWISKASE